MRYRTDADTVVLALPRGGVPVAYEVALALNAPLDVVLVRKLGLPGHAELAIGAIASGSVRVLNEELIARLHIPMSVIDKVAEWEQQELKRRERTYRGDLPQRSLEGHTVILVDDGLATGATMRAAVTAVRKHLPARVVIAVPVASLYTCHFLKDVVDDVVCAFTPEPLQAVGLWYDDFTPTTDEEVVDLLSKAREAHGLASENDDFEQTLGPAPLTGMHSDLPDPLQGIRSVITEAIAASEAPSDKSTFLTNVDRSLGQLVCAQRELRSAQATQPAVGNLLAHQTDLVERALSPLVDVSASNSGADGGRIAALIESIARLDVRIAHGLTGMPCFEVELSASSPSDFYLGLSGNDVVMNGGLFIATFANAPAVGEKVSVGIMFPGGDVAELSGVVAFLQNYLSDDTPAGFGVRFHDVPKEGAALVAEFAQLREPLVRESQASTPSAGPVSSV